MEEPRVTVGMPVYNDPAGLRRSVPTIFGQTWRGQLRVVVVDDGSTDETPEVLASLAAVYGRIEVVRHPENKGRPYARNTILELAGNDYLAWIDAGDLWHPRKLELQLAALQSEEARHPGTPVLCTGPLRWAFTDRDANEIRVPDVTGDQLRGALLGSVFPYLQGIVGRANQFRAIGGFDPRLLRRQDYDLLVRFVGQGGRVVSSPSHVPVFTYLKSDIGTSPELIAAANKVIRKKHRPYYSRYGWRIKREIRSKQHRLVARFYQHNGVRAKSFLYRAREKLWYPDLLAFTRRANGTGKGNLARPLRRLTRRAVLAVTGMAVLMLGRTRAVRLAQLAALPRLLASTGSGRSLHEEVRSGLARTSGGGTQSGSGSDDYPAWIAQLEAEVNAAAPAGGVEPWLRLESAYVERGLRHSAETALRRGLELHPVDEQLLVRLVELLSLRQKWADCVDLWSALPSNSSRATGITYARVARSLRELGRPAEAMAVATDGLRGWPAEFQLRQELYLSRAALVDWSKAIVPVAMGQLEADEAGGMVTDLGFLAGDDEPVLGWISSAAEDAPLVSLAVNGRRVATTSATTHAGPGWRGFSLSCHGVLPYLGDGDVVSVESAGLPLSLPGNGVAAEVATGYESRFAELERRLDSGFIFTKFGALPQRNNADQRKKVLALYDEISEVLQSTHGYAVSPFYGNLLGAIREHDIIAHDVGGFDMGYVSNHHDPEQVRAEFLEICRALLDRGYHLRVEPWSVYVRSQHSDQVFVDVNYAWFTHAGELNFSFGWRHPPVTDRDRFFYPRESLIGNHLVRVPGNAEQVLVQLYGPSWPVPDQGFALDAGLERDPEFLLTVDEMLSLEHADPDRVEARLEHHPAMAEVVRAD